MIPKFQGQLLTKDEHVIAATNGDGVSTFKLDESIPDFILRDSMTMNSIDEAAQFVEYSVELIGPDLISSCIDKDTSQKLSYATIKAGFTYCMGNNGGMIKVTEGWGEVSVANYVVVEGSGIAVSQSALGSYGLSKNFKTGKCSITTGWNYAPYILSDETFYTNLNGIMCDSAIYITGMSDNILRITCSV